MRNRINWPGRVLVVGISLMLICGLVSCGRAQRKPQLPGKSQGSQRSRPPEVLNRLKTGLDGLYLALKPLQPGTPEQLRKSAQATSKEGGGKQAGKQTGGEKKGEGKKGGEEKKAPPEGVDWGKLQQQAISLHEAWNALEPKVMHSGASIEAVTDFEQQLNALSTGLIARDRYASQMAANRAASFLPEFLELYDGKAPPDLLRLRCLTRAVVLRSEVGDWTGAEGELAAMPAVWSRTRPQAKTAGETDTGKIQYAITDLKAAVQGRDSNLVLLKADILEKDINALEKSLQSSPQS